MEATRANLDRYGEGNELVLSAECVLVTTIQ